MKRRTKRIYISTEVIADMFSGRALRFNTEDLPDDMVVNHISSGDYGSHVYAIVTSDSFDEVPEGCEMPYLNVEVTLVEVPQ